MNFPLPVFDLAKKKKKKKGLYFPPQMEVATCGKSRPVGERKKILTRNGILVGRLLYTSWYFFLEGGGGDFSLKRHKTNHRQQRIRVAGMVDCQGTGVAICNTTTWITAPVMGVGSVIGCYGIIGAGLTIASNTTIGDECVIGTGELLGDVLGKGSGCVKEGESWRRPLTVIVHFQERMLLLATGCG